jgi:hypothetical protein
MATLTAEQIQEKKQLLVEKTKEMKAIYDELVEAGAIELSEEELEKSTGGLFLLPGVLEALQKFGHLF